MTQREVNTIGCARANPCQPVNRRKVIGVRAVAHAERNAENGN
jgi:hypothetical protein